MSASAGADRSLITTRHEFDALLRDLRAAGRFALDTEFVSEETFEPVLCLVQVATADRCAAIDPIALDGLDELWELVLDPSVEVVMHAAGEDLRICKIKTGRLPRRVVDVQVAAGLVGFGYPTSLTNLVAQVMRVNLAGSETRTDWRRRPLTPAQIDYALDDVRHLTAIADKLNARLEVLDRLEWAESEYRARIEEIDARDDDDRWRRLPGLGKLSRRGLEAARLLSEWRLDEARRANRPPKQILRDDLLTAIARRLPRHPRDLDALREFNRPHLRNFARDLIEVVEAALATPNDDLPEHGERPEDGPGAQMVVSLLAATMNWCCAKSRVAVGLTGSQNDLRDVLRRHLDDHAHGPTPALLDGWRLEVCGRALLDVVSGRSSLRSGDPSSDTPIVVEPVAAPADEGAEAC